MKYYVVSDVHGFYTEMINALTEKGFFEDTALHTLVVCGDMMDRGSEAIKMQEFMMEQYQKGDLIFVRGNHEDLMMDLIENFHRYSNRIDSPYCHHFSNGTVDTACQLVGCSMYDLEYNLKALESTPFIKELIPNSVNYFETEHYIFVHGWIPAKLNKALYYRDGSRSYSFDPNWRNGDWEKARWLNGIDMAMKKKIIIPNKTIVCGHWHCSYGNYYYGEAETEFSDFNPFMSDGIIAIDSCTAYSGKVNCIVIED